MNTITLILLVFAFVLSTIAAWRGGEPASPFGRLVAAALAFYFLACILGNSVVAKHIVQ